MLIHTDTKGEMPSARFSMVSKSRISKSCANGLFSKSSTNGPVSKRHEQYHSDHKQDQAVREDGQDVLPHSPTAIRGRVPG